MTGYSRFRAHALCLGLFVIALGSLATPASAQEIRYYYDALNRLVGVVDAQGNGAEYIYDAVGNLLRIRRYTAAVSGDVAILLVRPSRGTVHTPVEIYGRGFSAVPAQNQVAFNGAAATVTAATESSLLTSVPAGASTGPITVITPLGSATTPDPFTVLGDFVVVPDQADVALGATLGFQALLDGIPTGAVTWRVNGVAGGSGLYGTITPVGVYAAPASPPPAPTVTVEAVRTEDPTWVAPATVRLDQLGGALTARPVSIGRAGSISSQAVSRALSVSVASSGGPVASLRVSVGVASPSAPATSPPLSVGPIPLTPPVMSGLLALSGAPVVRTVTPATGPVGGTNLTVSLTGGNFQGATAVRFVRSGSLDTTLTATGLVPAGDGSSLTFNLTIGGSAPTGLRVVQVLTPQGTSTVFDVGTNVFTVTAP